jgi:hypothetical protein
MRASSLTINFDKIQLKIRLNRTGESSKFGEFFETFSFNNNKEEISSSLTKISLLKDIDSISITLYNLDADELEVPLSRLEKAVIEKILTTINQQDTIKFNFEIQGISNFINSLIDICQQKSLNIVGLKIINCEVDGDTIRELVAFLKTTQLRDFCLQNTISKISEDDYFLVIQLLQDLKNYLTDFTIGNDDGIVRKEITNKLLIDIFLKIRNNHKLKNLRISDMEKMTDATLKIMKQCFKENTSLETLDFSGSGGGDNQGGEIIEKLFNAIKHSKSIINIDVSHQDITDDHMCVIAELLESNQQIQTINFNYTGFGEKGFSALAKALKNNKSIINLECWYDEKKNPDHNVDDISEELESYLKRNNKLNKSYLKAKENLELADQQAIGADLTFEQIEKTNQAYQLAIDKTKSILKKGYSKSQDLLDRCYLNYGLHLLRTGNYATGYQCFNTIDKSSSYYSLKQNELTNFLISYKPVQENEIQHRKRLINALSLLPDLYKESCAVPFKKIYLELMGENKVDFKVENTWQEIQKINPDKFNEVAIQIQKHQFYDAGVQPIIWDLQNQLAVLQNQIIDLQNKNDHSSQKIVVQNQEVSLSASGLFGMPKKRKHDKEDNKPEEEDNVDLESPSKKASFGGSTKLAG